MFLGLDVSSRIIGVSVINNNLEIEISEYLDLDGLEWEEKIVKTKKYFNELKKRAVIKYVFIEEPLTHANKNTFHTTAILQTWAGVVLGFCYDIFDVVPKFINVHSARGKYKIKKAEALAVPKISGKDKERKVKEHVYQFLESRGYLIEKELKKSGEIKETTYDKSDALLIALAGAEGCELKEFLGSNKSGRIVKKHF
jgi:hypothetical protein